MPALKFWLKTNNDRHNYELLIWKRIKNVRLARTGLLSANVTLVQSMPSFLYSSCSHKKMCCQTKNKTKFSERNIWFAAQLPQLIMKRSAFVKGYNLLAARMRILASLSVSRMEKKVFRLRSCFCRVSFPGERKLLLLQCFSTVISLFTWLKKNWSCSLAKLMQACSKLFFSKCSKPNISRIPTGCKKKKKRIWVTPQKPLNFEKPQLYLLSNISFAKTCSGGNFRVKVSKIIRG